MGLDDFISRMLIREEQARTMRIIQEMSSRIFNVLSQSHASMTKRDIAQSIQSPLTPRLAAFIDALVVSGYLVRS